MLGGSFPNGRGVVFLASSHASSYFTGAIFVNSSSIILKGETVFANNTAGDGGKTVKCTLSCNSGSNRKKLFQKKHFGVVPRAIHGS